MVLNSKHVATQRHIPLGLHGFLRLWVSEADLSDQTSYKAEGKAALCQEGSFNWKIGWGIKINLQHIMLSRRIKHRAFIKQLLFWFLLTSETQFGEMCFQIYVI